MLWTNVSSDVVPVVASIVALLQWVCVWFQRHEHTIRDGARATACSLPTHARTPKCREHTQPAIGVPGVPFGHARGSWPARRPRIAAASLCYNASTLNRLFFVLAWFSVETARGDAAPNHLD